MPTKKKRKEVYLTQDERYRIDALRLELQSPARVGTPHYQPDDETLADFIVRMALDHAFEIEQELMETDD